MSAPPDTSYVRTPPLKSLIFKQSRFRPFLILLASNFALLTGTPAGSPTPSARLPSRIKCPQRGAHRFPGCAAYGLAQRGAAPLDSPHSPP